MGTASTQSSAAGGDRPRFRQDLAAELIEEDGARYVDVFDIDSGASYRFYEAEYALACGMDGERDLPGLVRWASEELGLTPTPAELSQVVSALGSLGYLEGGEAALIGDATTQTAPVEDELAVGVVVSKAAAAPAPSGVSFDLGVSGAAASRASAPPAMPSPEFELGTPGAIAAPAAAAARTSASDFELGMPGAAPAPAAAKKPSLDLDVAVGLDDVKEAVRASRVMKAADVPPELAAQLDEPAMVVSKAPPREEPKAAPAPKVAPIAAPAPAPVPAPIAAPSPAPAAAAAKAPAAAAKAAVELPKPVVAKEAPAKTPAPQKQADKQGTSVGLIIALIVVILGAAGFAYYWFVMRKQAADAAETGGTAPTTGGAAPTTGGTAPTTGGATGATGTAAGSAATPAPVEPPTAKLAMIPGASVEPKAEVAGVVSSTVEDGATVTANQEIARLAGAERVQAKMAALTPDIEKKVPGEIAGHEKNRDAATAKGDTKLAAQWEAKAAERRARLEQKQKEMAGLQAELDKWLIRSPVDGVIKLSVAKKQRVAVGDAIATISAPSTLTAMFDIPAGLDTAKAKVVAKDSGADLPCSLSAVTAAKLTVTCTAGADGTDVLLK